MNLFRIFFILNTFLSGISQQDEMILFNGVSLDNWKEIEFEGQGEVSVRDSAIIIGRGKEITGVKL
jgi:hypothetical protein